MTEIATVPMPLSEPEWVQRFKPIKNPIAPSQGYNDSFFETYGKDLDFVRAARDKFPNTIWTMLDDGFIVSGYHYVNRQGYFICEVPFEDGEEFIVGDPDEDDDDVWALDDNTYPVSDWQTEVANNETRLGYRDWLNNKKEQDL
jgi:hypothetical protein